MVARKGTLPFLPGGHISSAVYFSQVAACRVHSIVRRVSYSRFQGTSSFFFLCAFVLVHEPMFLYMQTKELEKSIVKNFRGLGNTNFSPTPVHLLSLTTTLAQACGSTQLVIQTRQFTINAVRATFIGHWESS